MERYNLVKIDKKLQKELDTDRYHHTLGVMYTSAALAMCHGSDIHLAQTAGLLHDCAKCIPNDKKIRMCEKIGLEITSAEKHSPYLLHSKLGAYLAEHKYGVSDPDVLGAIKWHTTGKPDMSLLEKIVFTADYIEPMRSKAENLPYIRQLAFRDLDEAVYVILRDTLRYLEASRGSTEVDIMTLQAYRYYDLIRSREEEDYDE